MTLRRPGRISRWATRHSVRSLDPSQGSTRFLRASVIVLSAIGVTAGIARLLLMDDLLVIGDSYRARFFRDV